ncbi:MAG: 50S ribosomal protein L19 [Deltaproteobacteria bacterium]|nr:50S ribosomal protein L19 [Deltaproteobacteria bacterium]MBI3016880.1 50S ribosomal protein L19 [Deltaproteobacteria bacterium]
MNHLEAFEKKNLKNKFPSFKVGDTLRVHTKIKEGDKERIQIYEGVVTRYTKGDIRTAITVRKISFGVGVERVFPLHAPIVDKIEKVSEGKVRRGRLYYLRARRGKAARIESQWTEEVVETLGTVATGPVISSTEEGPEKKTSAALDAADYQKH